MFERLRDAGKLQLPDEDLALALFSATRELTETRGLPAYEVSNHARPGGESRHNLIYWRYGEYAGVGPGAHGRLATAEGPARPGDRAPPRDVADPGRDRRPRPRREHALEPRGAGRRIPADGPETAAKGSIPGAFEKLSGREIDRDRIKSLVEDGFIELTRAAASASPRWARRCSTPSSPTSRRKSRARIPVKQEKTGKIVRVWRPLSKKIAYLQRLAENSGAAEQDHHREIIRGYQGDSR